MRKVLAILSLMAIVSTLCWMAEAQTLSCGKVFESRLAELETKLQVKLQVVLSSETRYDGNTKHKLRIRDKAAGYVVGWIEFNYDPQARRVNVISMAVLTEMKKTGIGTVLYEQMLRHFATEEIVVESLASDNDEVMQEALKNGASVIEAIHQTPAYKIRQKLGFTEIIPNSINHNHGFSIRRPSN
jgi:GNAT superfamily N-acetyltransferase